MKCCFLGLILCVTASLTGQNLKIYKDFDQASKAARKQNKMLLVDVYTDWCGWCKVQDKKTFTDTLVINALNKNYIVLKINAEKTGDGFDFATRFCIRSYPTIYILNSGNRLVHPVLGYREAPDFLAELDSARKLNQSGFFYEGYSSAKNLNMPSFFYNRFQNEKRVGTPISKKSLDSFFFIKKFNSEESFLMMKLTGLNENYADEAIQSLKTMSGKFPKDEVEGILFDYLYGRVLQISADSTKTEKDIDALIGKYVSGTPEEKAFREMSLKIQFFEQRGNWQEYALLYDGYISKPGRWYAESVNEYAWTIYENTTDSLALQLALTWMSKVILNSEDYNYHDTYAALLFANGRNEEAEDAALHAIELGNASGSNVNATRELLQRIRSKP